MAIKQGGATQIDDVSTTTYAHLFQAFAEPARLAIVQHLAYGEHRVSDLVKHLGLAQSTVSKHVSFLLECGLLSVRHEGRASWYEIANPALLSALISAAENLIKATGNPAVLCQHVREHKASTSEGEV